MVKLYVERINGMQRPLNFYVVTFKQLSKNIYSLKHYVFSYLEHAVLLGSVPCGLPPPLHSQCIVLSS